MCGLVNKGVNIMNCINFQWDMPNMGCRVSTFSLETIVDPPTSLLIQLVTGGLFSGFIELHPNKFMNLHNQYHELHTFSVGYDKYGM